MVKKLMIKGSLLVLFVVLHNPLYGVNHWELEFAKADSLRYAENYEASIVLYNHALKECDPQSDIFLKYTIRLGISYFLNAQSEKAMIQFNHVLYTTRLDTLNLYRAHAFNNIGLLKDNYGEFKQSIASYTQAQNLYRRNGDDLMCDVTKMNIGIVYKKRGDYVLALKELTEAALGFENRSDNFQLAEAYSSIGGIQQILGDNRKALFFFKKALVLRQELEDKSGMASVYNNIGNLYLDRKSADSAIYFFTHALDLMERSGDRNAGIVLHNLGKSYEIMHDIDHSRQFYQNALAYKLSLNDSNEIAITHNALARFELEQNNTSRAFEILCESKNYISEASNVDQAQFNYELWKEYYKSIGKMDSAIYFFELSSQCKRRIDNESYLKELAYLQESFEAKSNQHTIDTLKVGYYKQAQEVGFLSRIVTELKSSLLILSITFVFVILTVILLWYVLKQNSKKQKLLAKLNGIELEKKRISMQLHDAVGSSLKTIEEKLRFLHSQSSMVDTTSLLPIINLMNQTTEEIIMISHDLHHPVIEKVNFCEFIEDFLFDAFENSSIHLVTEINNSRTLDNLLVETKHHVFRCLQEMIMNVKQHAHSKTVKVTTYEKDTTFFLRVEDDGVGFDPKKNKGAGIGLKNIEMRLHGITGSLSVQSPVGRKGTHVIIQFPIKTNSNG